jgi:myosin heavy subunit
MDRGTIDSKLTVGEAYNKYLVWKQRPGTVFEFATNKKWYWVKKPNSTQVEFLIAELKSLENKKATLLPKASADVCSSLFVSSSLTAQTIALSEAEIDGYEMNDQRFDGVDDCAQMTHLSDASVLHNLKVRWIA